jgi:hypothetical protein
MVSRRRPRPEIRIIGPIAVCRIGTSSLNEVTDIIFLVGQKKGGEKFPT